MTRSGDVTDQITWVPPAEWLATLAQNSRDGFSYLDLLTAIDRLEAARLEVVAHLICVSGSAGVVAQSWWGTSVDRADPRLDSLTSWCPAAIWHERELHEMFGIVFRTDADDGGGASLSARLLLSSASPAYPLRKDQHLIARVVKPWPGSVDAGGRPQRRRQAPPGVPVDWLRDE